MKNMRHVGWTHALLFITGNQGGMSSVEKVTAILICLSGVNCQILKLATTFNDKF